MVLIFIECTIYWSTQELKGIMSDECGDGGSLEFMRAYTMIANIN